MKLGFVGVGNMASAIIKGVVKTGALAASDLHVYDINAVKATQMAEKMGINRYADCERMIQASDMVLMAVKPHQLKQVIAQNAEHLAGKAVISIAAGWTMDMLTDAVPRDVRVLRVMPNTPALVGEGMTVMSRDTTFNDAERDQAERIFHALGRVLWVDEHQMEAVTGLSGSGPAYGYIFIEAMADGGVSQGLTRPQALEMAAQTLLGAAKMVLESDLHPGELKDMVCSPSGTTIAAVRELERKSFRSVVIEAVIAASERAGEMNK